MRPEEIDRLLRRRPFAPFRIFLSDGTPYDVKHPEMALLTRSTIDIGMTEQQGSLITDRVVYCALVHVVRVEHLDGQASAAT